MLGTRFLQYVGKNGAYYRRMLDATREQWPRMHEKTATKLRSLQTRLGSFFAGDVRDYLDTEVPADAPVVMFPPFYASDYQAQFAPIDAAFDWPEPSFDELTEDGKERIIEQVQDRPNWVLGLHIERPELRDKLAGVVQTANRGLPIYVYAAAAGIRTTSPAAAWRRKAASRTAVGGRSSSCLRSPTRSSGRTRSAGPRGNRCPIRRSPPGTRRRCGRGGRT